MPDISAYRTSLSNPDLKTPRVQLARGDVPGAGAVVSRWDVGIGERVFSVLGKAAKESNAQVAYDFRRALAREYGDQIADRVFAEHIGKPGERLEKSISADRLRRALAAADRASLFQEALKDRFGDCAAREIFAKHVAKGRDIPVDGELDRFLAAQAASGRGLSELPDAPMERALTSVVEESRPFRAATGVDEGGLRDRTARLLDMARDLAGNPPSPLEGSARFAASLAEFQRLKANLLRDLGEVDQSIADIVTIGPGYDPRAADGEYYNKFHPNFREIQRRLNAFESQLVVMSAQMDAVMASRPTTVPSVAEFAKNWVDAAIRVATRVGGDAIMAGARAALDARMAAITTDLAGGGGRVLQPAEFAARMKAIEPDLLAVIKEAYREAGQKPPGDDDIKTEFRREWVAVMNAKQWDAVDKNPATVYDGKALRLHSVITPAGRLTDRAGGTVFPGYGGRGVCCASFSEAEHAVNLAETRLDNPAGEGGFVALRHGVHSAVGIADAAARKAANLSRAREAAIAAATIQLKKNPNYGLSLQLNLTSVSLLSPDCFRTGEDGERQMLDEQTEAWRELVQKVKDDPNYLGVSLGGRPVPVRLSVATFNYGVNEGAMRLKPYRPFAGIWNRSEQVNGSTTGRQLLSDRVEQFLLDNPRHPDRKIIIKLRDQIRGMWEEKSFKRPGAEPYKLAARLTVLTSLMGDVPLWNCKSGKDRTGQMDAEAKFLYARIRLAGDVPDPDAPLGEDDRRLLRAIALDGGNHEMQVMNTGMAGFKLGDVPENYQRMGGDAAFDELHEGGALYVKA